MKRPEPAAGDPLPRGRRRKGADRSRLRLLAGIRADVDSSDLPGGLRLQWHVHPSWRCVKAASHVVPLRGQRSFGSRHPTLAFCFPFNCEGKDTFTGTNGMDL